MRRRLTSIALTGIMLVPLLAACTPGAKGNDEEERVLRIATTEFFNGEDENFREEMTSIFEFNNPNIKVEIISVLDEQERIDDRYINSDDLENTTYKDPLEQLQALIEGPNPPDLVAASYDEMITLIDNNLLAPLDSKIAEDKFDMTDFVPVVYDGIKDLSPDGKLYALAPFFSSSVLVYNKKIFADAGVEPPKDHMTWDEIFALAQRVTKLDDEKPINGFSFNSHIWSGVFENLYFYSDPLKLRYFDDIGERMIVDTPEWEEVWTKLYQLQKDRVLPSEKEDLLLEEEDYDRFMSGSLGMAIMSHYKIGRMIEANNQASQIPGYTPIDFDIVTIPSHPENPGVVSDVYISELMGISSKATNAEDAWEFLKFINGPKWAELKSRRTYELSARKSYIKPIDGADINMEAFYNIKPSSFIDNSDKILMKRNGILFEALQPGSNELELVLKGEKSAKEALQSWQAQGDLILQESKANQK